MILRRIVGNSMRPTLSEGDILFARKHRKIAKGDIVIAKYDNKEIIKRVKKITGKRYYLEGDNKKASTDSRKFGPVRDKDITAVAVFVVGTSRFARKHKTSRNPLLKLAILGVVVLSSFGLIVYNNFAKSEKNNTSLVVNPIPNKSPKPIQAQYPVNEIKKDVPYCNEQALDIYYPTKVTSETAPVVIYMHGGGWENNTKSSEMDQIGFVDGLRNEGYAIVSIDYRKLPDHSFPDPVNDALCSVRFLRAEHEKLGIDSYKIAVFGFSAGGHLAAMVGMLNSDNQFNTGPYKEQSSRVKVVVTLAGLFDFEHGLRYNNTLRLRYFLKDADWIASAPITYASPDDPPVLMLHGMQDEFISPEQDDLFGAKLQELGIKHRIVHVDNAGHGLGGVGGQPSLDIAQISQIIRDYIKDNIGK
jgi:acetyl esterase/lipase